MILTGKAKEDFENGIIEILKQNYNEKIHDNKRAISWIYDSNDLILFAHIIEWFDEIKHPKIQIVRIIWNTWSNSTLSYKETVIEAIKKANEIYNSK